MYGLVLANDGKRHGSVECMRSGCGTTQYMRRERRGKVLSSLEPYMQNSVHKCRTNTFSLPTPRVSYIFPRMYFDGALALMNLGFYLEAHGVTPSCELMARRPSFWVLLGESKVNSKTMSAPYFTNFSPRQPAPVA